MRTSNIAPLTEMLLENFRGLIEVQRMGHALQKGTHPAIVLRQKVVLKLRDKYACVDVDGSGAYMVDLSTEEIFGIKGYGRIHRGYQFGNLSTVGDFDWSESSGFRCVRYSPERQRERLADAERALSGAEVPAPVIATPQDYPALPADRSELILAIRAALGRRSGGMRWAVTGGEGTAWGWLSIGAPRIERIYDSSGNRGGFGMSLERRKLLAQLLGLPRVDSHGVRVPAGDAAWAEAFDRAAGRAPRCTALTGQA